MEKSVETIGTKLKAKFKSERGEIGDSLIIVVGLLIGAVLMFMFPLMSSSERTDDISQMAITTATEDFINKIRTTGKITATGNTFDVDMTVYQLDENPGVKVTQAEMTKIGENVYYTIYTSQIEEKLNQSGRMKLKEGDRVTVTVKNTNQTIAQQLRNFFYQMLGNESYQIAAQKSAIVTVNGSN